MLVYLAVIAAATATDHISGPTAGGILVTVFGAVLGALVVAAHRRDTGELAHDEPAGIDAMLRPADITDLIPVAHEGATDAWSPADWCEPVGDPLTRELSDMELGEALLFDEIAAAFPIRFDWAPPTASQAWAIAGERLAEMGATQPLPRIEVAA